MALPSNAQTVVFRGFWFDEDGSGAQVGGFPATVTFEPIPLTGTAAPNLRDATAYGYIKTRTITATVDEGSGYFAAVVVASNDPDLDAYGGRRVTLQGEMPFVVEVPHNAPTVTVDERMAAAVPSLQVGGQVQAVWLVDAATAGGPPPQPVASYLTSEQTIGTIADGIEAHDADPDAHADIRALAQSNAATVADATTTTKGQAVLLGGTAANPTVPYNKVTDAPTSLPPSGGAGGVLAGSYPNPGFAQDMATQAELDAARDILGKLLAPGVPITNPRGLRRWSAALSDAVFGPAVVSVYGDSISKGVGSDGAANDSSAATYPAQGWVGQLRSLFATTYGDTGEGNVGTLEGGNRWVFAGGASATASTGPYENGGRCTGAGHTITIAVPQSTQIDIWVWDGSSSTANYTVDGSASTALSTGSGNTSSTTWNKRSITGLADTPHTLVIEGNNIYVSAVVALRKTTGVQVHRFARSGSTSANLVGQDSSLSGNTSGQTRMLAAAAKVPQSDLLIIALGVNDFTNQNTTATSNVSPGTTPTQYAANLQTTINQVVANGACVLLVGEPRQNATNFPNPATYSEADYWAAARTVAAASDHCAFIDVNDLWGSNLLGQQLMFYTSASVHPTRRGHGSMARLLHRLLTLPMGTNATPA